MIKYLLEGFAHLVCSRTDVFALKFSIRAVFEVRGKDIRPFGLDVQIKLRNFGLPYFKLSYLDVPFSRGSTHNLSVFDFTPETILIILWCIMSNPCIL